MTHEQVAVFSVTNDFYMWGGVILGLILGGVFKTLSNIIANRFERPRRIRFGNLNGRHERKDNFEYLYLYNGSYYTLEQRDFLIKEKMKNFKQLKDPFTIFYPIFCFVLMCLAVTYFFINFQSFGF